jgi:hypothetical protein
VPIDKCRTAIERSINVSAYVWDMIFVGMTVAFFAIGILYTYACEKL